MTKTSQHSKIQTALIHQMMIAGTAAATMKPTATCTIHKAAFQLCQGITPHQITLYVVLNFWPKLVHCVVLLQTWKHLY